MLAIYLTLLASACLLGIFVPAESSRAEGLGFFVAIANFSVWAGWLSRLVLLQKEAASLQAPGIAAAVSRALLYAAVLSVFLPGLALLALGVPAATAFGASAVGVLGGLLFALMPWPAAIGLLMVPAAAPALAPYLPPMGPFALVAAAAFGLLMLVTCWRSVVRSADPADIPAWRRPVMLQAPGGMVAWTDPKVAAAPDAPRIHEGWLVAMPRPDHAGPHAPRAAIDALLAGPMGYVAKRTVLRQWALMAFLVLAVLMIPFRGDAPLVRDALLIGGVVGLLGGGWTLAMRLERQRRRVSGELAELALLPGLGDPGTAAARLVRSIGMRLTQLMLFALAGLLLLARVQALALSHVVMLVGLSAGVSAASAFLCASVLAGRHLASWRTGLIMSPMLVAAIATLMLTLLRNPLPTHALAWPLVWTVLTAAYLVAVRSPLRSVRARPHAFLLD